MMLDVASKIYAFEPHPVTFKQLEKNNQVNGDRILLVNKGLGDEEAVLPFTNQQSETNHIVKETLNTAAVISVPVTTLDAFAENNLNKNDRYLVKIDVEGFEDEVLKGADYFFNSYKIDALVIETDNARRKAMIEFFTSKDYVCDFSEKSNNIRAYKKTG
jgi:FkbM family methyltransferase